MNIDLVKEKLFQDWYTIKRVKLMGAYKALITFISVEDMEDALSSDYLLNQFYVIRRWSVSEFC